MQKLFNFSKPVQILANKGIVKLTSQDDNGIWTGWSLPSKHLFTWIKLVSPGLTKEVRPMFLSIPIISYCDNKFWHVHACGTSMFGANNKPATLMVDIEHVRQWHQDLKYFAAYKSWPKLAPIQSFSEIMYKKR